MSLAHDAAASMKVFECKTCNRQFSTFQALGGHCASHRKTRTAGGGGGGEGKTAKARAHECPICGLEFAVGQALGGHMRRHRSMTMKTEDKGAMWLDLNSMPAENDFEARKEGRELSTMS
ncbi:zinc finger protein ZAT8-like isoform X2 [Phalaenopsis equestris]|uniref:zinc finger protein ZAT8-like isoform X2 n=1 Tax=Phalaenopsis equestris TaxID=78828 RepID=UPI0009E3711F|nr:zinc finger protein ZAT8-like isoform X2 [Phalaenopsis equestris]